jgi:Cu2+-exporting ATPase
MKTSTIEVRDMLSVLAVDEVEKRICAVPGVESATANYAAGSVTVRYDETRLDVADIKAIVHQRGHQPAGESQPKHVSEHEPAREHAALPAPEAPTASASAPTVAVPPPDAQPSTPTAGVPKASTAASAAAPAPVAPAADGHSGHAAPGAAAGNAPQACLALRCRGRAWGRE